MLFSYANLVRDLRKQVFLRRRRPNCTLWDTRGSALCWISTHCSTFCYLRDVRLARCFSSTSYLSATTSSFSTYLTLFADDTKFMEEFSRSTHIQQDLDSLHTWCSEWKLSLNSKKCSAMRFSLTSSLPSTYTVNGQTIKSHKDLGITTTSNLAILVRTHQQYVQQHIDHYT